jgi:hypothetical protein
MNADLLNIGEKKARSFTATTIMTGSDITKPFLTLYLSQHICLTQWRALADTLLGATINSELYQKSRYYLS